MYFYLIFKLARFISKSEQATLAEDLKQLLTPYATFLEISNDRWGANIGRQASEPLRASQAAAYVLGTLYSL